ncbi:MAG: hypothetical protein E6I32_04230 [Chloroflexi bacterium]|nr:MAG: hypothetical protein E6I32_04230 [Chloroflexota bacterium]
MTVGWPIIVTSFMYAEAVAAASALLAAVVCVDEEAGAAFFDTALLRTSRKKINKPATTSKIAVRNMAFLAGVRNTTMDQFSPCNVLHEFSGLYANKQAGSD